MQKKKKKNKLFVFLIICFVLVPFLLTKGCNYIESLNQAKNSVSEPITSISEQIQPSAHVYTHAHTPARTHSRSHNAGAYAHERAHTRVHNAHVYAQTHSISKANWTGTAVPNAGAVDKIYINIDLSNEDVISILNNISDWTTLGAESMYIVFSFSDGNILYIMKMNGAYGMLFSNGGIIYQSEQIEENFIGWNPSFNTGVLDFSNDNLTFLDSYEGIIVGADNDKLSGLFSVTPFEQSSNNELSIGNLFSQLGNAIIIFGGAVVNVFISMEPIFWNEGPTLIFILLIAAVSFALVFWGIELLISLVGVSRTKRKKKK